MLLYAYFTPKVDFKRKFNHHQSSIDSADDSKISNRTINTNRISNRTYDSKSNRITKLRRSLIHTVYYVTSSQGFLLLQVLTIKTCPADKIIIIIDPR